MQASCAACRHHHQTHLHAESLLCIDACRLLLLQLLLQLCNLALLLAHL
jgi:hypothetical protein